MRLPATLLISALVAYPGWVGADDVGLCFTGSGNHRIDIDVCSRALQSDIPSQLTRATLLTKRAEAFLTASLNDLALRDIARALAVNPLSSRAYRLRGDAHTSAGNNDLAIESYNQSLNLNIRSEKAYKQRGIAFLMLRRPSLAIADFKRSLEILASDPEVHALLAISLFAVGDYPAAEQGMRDALAKAYPYPLGYLWALASARKQGRNGNEHSRIALQETDPHIWPGQLVRRVIGKTGGEIAPFSTNHGRENLRARQNMQTDFHLGLQAWSLGDRETAVELFGRVAAIKDLAGSIEIPVARLLLEDL